MNHNFSEMDKSLNLYFQFVKYSSLVRDGSSSISSGPDPNHLVAAWESCGW